MSARHDTSSLQNTESSACQSSSIHFVSPEVSSKPCNEEDYQENSPTESNIQTISQLESVEDDQGIKDESSDSTLLLDGHGSCTNGESFFENENVFRKNEALRSRIQFTEDESTEQSGNGKENPSNHLDSDERYFQNTAESRTSDIRPQPEILLQPLSLRAASSETNSSSREELRSNPSCSVRFKNPIVEHGSEEIRADPTSNIHFIKGIGIRQNPDSTAEHGKEELGTNPSLSDHFIMPTATKEHSIDSAKHGREELGAATSWSVRFIRPASDRYHPSPITECGRENRDIFETGGEHSKHPPAKVSRAGNEEIELLPGESPEPRIVISPSFSEESRLNLCKLSEAFLCRWCSFISKKICRQFRKAPVFYFLSTSTIFLGINSWDREWLDRDLSVAIMISFSVFIVITLIFDRGQFSHVIGGRNSCIGECRRGCGNADPCIPWCCCSSSAPLVERHSQYRHLEEDGSFRHEIADVSNLDPKDFPQMKMVEQRECGHAESPDYLPEVSQVNADVHVGKRDGEKLGSTRKHLGRAAIRAAKPHKGRSARSPPKTFRADIHAPDHVMSDPPELSPIRETALEEQTQSEDGQPTKDDEVGTRTTGAATTPKNLEDGSCFKKFSDCSPTLPRFANIPRSDDCFRADVERSTSPEDESFYEDVAEVSDAEKFMCEHYGQSVACSCPTLLLAKTEESIQR